ncbi:MAG: G4 quadruplex nucleic acid binding protein [Pycnora praestabilis]|nr:MAG: G4 quadruplex nucleic acid binding protein [Pycnora praestabilis]
MSTSDPLLRLLQQSFPLAILHNASTADIAQLSPKFYPDITYTDTEKAEINQWLTTSTRVTTASEDDPKTGELLQTINSHLSARTTLLGSKPSVADIALYARLAPTIAKWTPDEKTGEHGYHHIVRHADFVQNAPAFGLNLREDEKIEVNVNDVRYVQKPIDPKEEKERKKKEKAAASNANGEHEKPLVVGGQGGGKGRKEKAKETNAAEQPKEESTTPATANDTATPPQPKREKKDKQPKAQKQPPKETPLSPCLIDLRVGHILKAINHPNADSLYVSTIVCGDPEGTDNTSVHEETGQVVRTVCSGLNGLVPLDEMQGRKVIVVCNLKPVTMRGIKSAAMVLAASPRLADGAEDTHGGPVELVSPPSDSKAGERVYFEGWAGEPESVLNPKKKIWESIQPGFTTTKGLEVAFDAGVIPQLSPSGEGEGKGEAKKNGGGKLVTAAGGKCVVKSLTGAVVR